MRPVYRPWTAASNTRIVWTWRPVNLCQFSGCPDHRDRTVVWKGVSFDLCKRHATNVEAGL